MSISLRTGPKTRSRNIPEAFRGSYSVQHCPAHDYIDYYFGRYRIGEFAAAHFYQPLLYVDTDVMFNRPVEPLLLAVADSQTLCAVSEPFSRLSDAASVGAFMFNEHGIDVGRRSGFNSGCIGIPSLAACGRDLRLVLDVARGYIATHGRYSPGFVDQPVANYVWQILGTLDVERLSPFSQIGPWPMQDSPTPLGMVHFWRARRLEDKRAAMTSYLAHLETESAGSAD